MIAAIYARKSTDDKVPDEEKSVARQIEHARAFANRQGWIVDEASVFFDDGISGAEFARRPGYVQLMAALKPRPRFQVLVMSEESRLGRESTRTMSALSTLLEAGVRVFFYLENRELRLGSFQDNTMAFLRAEFAAEERRKAAERTHDALRRKFLAGHVVGGVVFGYDNVDVKNETGRRTHAVRRVNEAQAAVVRRIFRLCAEGVGQVRIARTLNEERALAPMPRKGGPQAWAPTTVREILFRDLYRGVSSWNRKKKRDDSGQERHSNKPSAEWLQLETPELRIVSDTEWYAAHRRLSNARAEYDRVTHGQRKRVVDRDSKYLLVGFSRCSVCGGKLCVQSRARGKRGRLGRAFYYRCTSNLLSGASICSHSQLWPMTELDQEVLGAIAGDVLTPEVVEEVVTEAHAMYSAGAGKDAAAKLRTELEQEERAIANLLDAISIAGGELSSLVNRLREKERRRGELRAQLQSLDQSGAPAPWREIERLVRQNLTTWRSTLLSDVAQAREALRKLLRGPISFTPLLEEGSRALRFEGRIGLAVILGELGASGLVTRAGIEPATL